MTRKEITNEQIEVFGRGAPLILIDNRKVRDASELQLLQSDNIKSIQIITMPGAEYGSTIRSVIKIQTKQKFIIHLRRWHTQLPHERLYF